MSRPVRIQYANAWYYVMNRGQRGELAFRDEKDHLFFLDLLKESIEMWGVRVSAYCLMPTYYHLLIRTPNANLSRFMRHLNGVYTQYFNRKNGLDGPLFRGRYKSILVDKNSYLLELLRYIHRNPLQEGLEKKLGSYPWCSYKSYISLSKKWNWLYKGFPLKTLCKEEANQISEYKKFMAQKSSDEINQIFSDIKKVPYILGSEKFVKKIREKYSEQIVSEEGKKNFYSFMKISEVIKIVCKYYKADIQELKKMRRGINNEARNVAIYLSRTYTGKTLNEIGSEFDILKYSTVSSIVGSVKSEIQKDKKLKNRIEMLKKSLKIDKR